MLGCLEMLLNEMVTHPEMRITELSLLTEAERHQSLVEWNQTVADYPRNTVYSPAR